MILKGIAWGLALLALQLFLLLWLAGVSADQRFYREAYRNQKYGYSITMLQGFEGITDPPPAPQHGITIPLNENPKEQIWVDGSYNAALWPTIEVAMNRHIEWLQKEADGVAQLSRRTMRLDGLRAIRDVSRYRDRETGSAMVQDVTLAMRNTKRDGQILYTVGLRTRESSYEKHKLLLDEVIGGWRREPIY